MCGDPIEIAAIKGIQWSYDSDQKVSRPGAYMQKKRLYERAKDIMEREYDKSHKQKLEKDVADAKRVFDLAKLESKKASVTILQRHHFASKLQRMSTVCRLEAD